MAKPKGNDGPARFDLLEKDMQENPDNYFPDFEIERRMSESMRRFCHFSPQMNFKTGQNLQPPFLSETELKRRGYPAEGFPFE